MTSRLDLAKVDPGLLGRFRAAGEKILWRPAPGPAPRAGRARVAHLHDEEARVEEAGRGSRYRITTDSGPVGALVLLLEIDRRGPATELGAADAGRLPAFPSGALVASWGRAPRPADSHPTVHDLVELARYALA